jgi:uncharacterized protein (DUF1800 family)
LFGWEGQANAKLSSNTRHILERLSFGVTSEQIQEVDKVGIQAYIQSQLNPQLVSESPVLKEYLAKLDPSDRQAIELQKKEIALREQIRTSKLTDKQQREIRQELNKLRKKVKNDAIDAHLARAIYSNRQLQEVMVDFWFNHFNVYAQKGAIPFWLSDYENRIRINALGNFRNLLAATAKHPAMLIYLDNRRNTAPDSPVGIKTKNGLNENYARELMELHTLGVDGGYTQDDVIALARILTGWNVDLHGKKGTSGFYFYKNRHDRHDKVFLGHQIKAGGIEEGERALDILASHPATARHISYKLAQYFVADEPPVSLVNSLAKQFIESKGNIKVVLETLMDSKEFNSSKYYKQKFKTPWQYLISLVRMAEIEQPNFKRIQGMLNQLSMPIYMYSAPIGYQNTHSAWLNPQAMLQRTSFATAIANGALNKNYEIDLTKLKANLGKISQHTKQTIAKNPPKLRSALIMGSPQAMYR